MSCFIILWYFKAFLLAFCRKTFSAHVCGVYAPYFFGGIFRLRSIWRVFCLCERSEAISREGGGVRSICSVLFRWDISLTHNMTRFFLHVILNGSEESHRRTDRAYTLHFGRGIFRLRSIWRTFIYMSFWTVVKNPTEELTGIFSSLWSWDISLTLNMTYFYLYVILSMSSEQTCLQGFANEDIHKAQAFCKNAKR